MSQSLIIEMTATSRSAVQAVLAPLAIFGDDWTLNVLYIATLGLLGYGLLVAAPRQ
jgi:hypothetical protein